MSGEHSIKSIYSQLDQITGKMARKKDYYFLNLFLISSLFSVIVSSSLDSSLIFWDLTSGRKMVEIPTGTTDVWKVAFSPNGEKIATGGHTGKVHIYEIQNGDIDKMLDTRGKFILSVAWVGVL